MKRKEDRPYQRRNYDTDTGDPCSVINAQLQEKRAEEFLKILAECAEKEIEEESRRIEQMCDEIELPKDLRRKLDRMEKRHRATISKLPLHFLS